ncbi:MAG TPA: 3-dehydroquinate synthase [Cytophagales bacterium]|nr:3-dehydroquinate synthase [Cytophagales bacterium]HAP63220.1 3-dehydroquinate synthase [Cytophagales bacterium]
MLPDSLVFTADIAAELRNFLQSNEYSKILLLCDTNTEKHCYPLIKEVMPKEISMRVAIPPGEEHKRIETVVSLWDGLTRQHFDRKALMINLGGGVIGDMGGFAAATYKRGIDFINIPTTLLAMVDASVGGKLGIDFEGFKNQVGVFKDPTRVFIDPVFLNTLPERQLRSGYAEILKHGLIANAWYWERHIESPWREHPWATIIEHSVGIKQGVVTADPFEKGLRKILNFGHTIGHAVETFFLKEGPVLLHGEAIAVGMVAEAFLSTKLTGLPEDQRDAIARYLVDTFGHVEIPDKLLEEVVELVGQDKKNEANVVKASLLKTIGNCTFNIPVSSGDVIDSLFYYRSLGVQA